MKIIENSQGSVKKKFLFSRIFAEMYYFCALHIYLLLSIIGFAVGVGVLLFIAELIFPSAVHIFNYSMTDKIFHELVADHKYHAAIDFMDVKKGVIDEAEDPYQFRMELADCYYSTGDYPKALEQYRLIRKWFNDKLKKEAASDLSKSQLKQITDITNFFLQKEEFRIYLKMGDVANVRNLYNQMNHLHKSTDWNNLAGLFGEEVAQGIQEKLGDINLADGFRLELIQGKYITNPQEAIREMEKYTIDVAGSRNYNQVHKLKLYNELLRMLLEQDQHIVARHYIEQALKLVDMLEYNSVIFSQLGDLSEYCYQLNDMEDGRRLLKKYLSYIDDTYDKIDIEYAVAHAKEYKYMEADGNWDQLAKRVVDASSALRTHIANNFTGMTAAQREYLIEQFKPLFAYSNNLLERHPSDELAVSCFENNMFLQGLLLRSEASIANTIASMNNPELVKKYDRYKALSQELTSRQYLSGAGNYYAKLKLEREIATLETEIANDCMEFRRANESANSSISDIKKSLGKNEIAVQIVEGDKSVFALISDRSGDVAYQPLASKEAVRGLLSHSGAIYVDPDAVNKLFGKIIPAIEGKTAYLSTSGMLNQVAFSALPIGNEGRILADVAKVRLVGSIADIASLKSRDPFNMMAKNTILWGGIEYGKSDSIPSQNSTTRGIMRGDVLGRLIYSQREVEGIASLLRVNKKKATVVSGVDATEASFISRSRKRDYILHVSTHGFFHDSGSFTNPMRNSGLLFANSQKYWQSPVLASSINKRDGILRADEISNLDLNGCRLVVLSACQTGLGEYNSEGVYGLQRAFKLAGAQSILMSLWSVDDAATCELMTELYREMLNGKEPDDALTWAQRTLRLKGYSPDKWAAFVLLN